MTTLEHLKAEARTKASAIDVIPPFQFSGAARIYSFTDTDLNRLIEHTHTQTIQSVRERIKRAKAVSGQDDILISRDDLLKDLEAPVEGDNVN